MIEDMDTNNQYKPGSTGAGRKKSKPDYDRNVILRQQMDQVVELYGMEEHPSLQSIAEETSLNTIKVRKLLITAGVYKSEIADHVQKVFQSYVDLGLSHKDAIAGETDGGASESVGGYPGCELHLRNILPVWVD